MLQQHIKGIHVTESKPGATAALVYAAHGLDRLPDRTFEPITYKIHSDCLDLFCFSSIFHLMCSVYAFVRRDDVLLMSEQRWEGQQKRSVAGLLRRTEGRDGTS